MRTQTDGAVESVPAIGIFGETGTLYANDAEALAGWGLHHDPALKAFDYRGAQPRQARDFGSNIVALDINVNAALVVHSLDLHNRLVGRDLQHTVITATIWMLQVHGAA